ncbi:MAG: GNAT family N-acetyltransferase [Cyanobacteria bacterium RUI128]|nr:GNAT family N-acetyltransferase [Cyanobacteria bacterium RUI128]
MRISLAKPEPIPDILFYEPVKNCYRMIDMKRGVMTGEMSVCCRKDLVIESLNIVKNERRKGYGTKFLDFAKNLSRRLGYDGDMRLMAAATAGGESVPPHVFYRKYGFDSNNKAVLERIDNSIKTGEKLDIESAPPVYMYYVAK